MTLQMPQRVELPAAHMVIPGAPIEWAGETYVISTIDLGVTLADGQGRPVMEIPYASAVEALQRDRGAPEYDPRAHLIDDDEEDEASNRAGTRRRLSPAAGERLKWARNTLHILATGLERTDHPSEKPPENLDPRLLPLSTRVTNLANLRAEKLRRRKPREGEPGNPRSERRKIERLLEAWREGGEPATLDPRIGVTGQKYSKQDDELWNAIRTWLWNRSGKSNQSIEASCRDFTADWIAAGNDENDLPSPRTLWDMFKDFKARQPRLYSGSAKARESAINVPDASGVQRETSRPGELVLFDTTKANVYVVDPRTGRTYRPEVTIALDHYTRAIVGMSISIITAGITVALCLADVLRPKTPAAVADWSLPGDNVHIQPYVGKPKQFVHTRAFEKNTAEPGTWGVIGPMKPEKGVVDNGRPFVSAYITAQIARLGIDWEPQRTYTPTNKAQVERAFRTIKDMFESLMPGYTGGSVYDRGSKVADDNLMTASLYERRLRQCIDIYNNKVNKALVDIGDPFVRMTPFMMWRLSHQQLGPMAPPDSAHDWMHLMPSKRVTLNPGGFRINRLQYNNPQLLRRLADDPVLARGRKIHVFYNPLDLRSVWTFDTDGTPQEIRWTHWQDGMPRFGEMATNGAVKALGMTAMTDRRMFQYLTQHVAAWRTEDASIAIAGHTEVDAAFERIIANYDELDGDEARDMLNDDLHAMQVDRFRPPATKVNADEPIEHAAPVAAEARAAAPGPAALTVTASDPQRRREPRTLGTFDRFGQ